MTIAKLVKELCAREGLKKQVEVAQVRELVGHLSDLVFENVVRDPDDEKVYTSPVCNALLANGQRRRRAKRRKNP